MKRRQFAVHVASPPAVAWETTRDRRTSEEWHDIDVTPVAEAHMVEHWPIALDRRKVRCETRDRAARGT